MEKAQFFFENYIQEKAESFTALPQSGSARINYIAETSKGKFVITQNENIRENEAFFYFSEVFSSLNLNTPKIFKISEDRKTYIQEHLGEKTFSEIIAEEGLNSRTENLVKQTLDQLYNLQKETEGKIDYSKTFEYESYDELPILNDLFYFKKMFVDILEIEYHKSSLLQEFKKIVEKIENLEPKGLMIRDFQSRNILVNREDKVFFIDYQSAMKGPLMYDVISFLHQAKANFPKFFKDEMTQYYLSKHSEENQIQLKNSVEILQLIRYLQVLGAYGFRGLIQRKPHFISSIQQGMENLIEFSKNWDEMQKYSELQKIINVLGKEETKIKIQQILNTK